jgi:DNA-binding NtrC family response regulator
VSTAIESLEEGQIFDLIIADLMMPQAGGMELLKVVRERWPHTPVLIITGYASIASAVETAKFGAVGYLPKPFTPGELETAVNKAFESSRGEVSKEEESPADPLDVDMPFDRQELTRATSQGYVEQLTRSDMPMVKHQPPAAVGYCFLGERSCKRFVKQGMCKQPECPLIVSERKKAAKAGVVVSIAPDPIDVDMPFSRREVAAMTSDAYVNALGRSDMPVVGFWQSEASSDVIPKVLVVDDEPVVVNSIRKILTRGAYRVESAFSGREALSRISRETYDLVMLDMRLPDANGLELLDDIRKRKPGLRVVIITGYASVDNAVEAIRRGAHDYMAKPFTPDELCALTRRALERVA